MHSDTFVLKAQLNSETVYLKLQWKQNDVDLFHLQVFGDGKKSWSGAFSNDQAQTYIDDLFQTKDIYYANTKTCLTGEGGDEYKLVLSLYNEDSTTEVSWKKRYKDFFQVQGSMKLSLDIVPVTQDAVIDFLIDENKSLRTAITKMYQQLNEVNADLMKSHNELGNFINVKDTVESTLYGKFVQLLNTKKQRIQFLEEQLLKYGTE